MTITNATVTGSDITVANSYSVPSVGSTGTLKWIAKKISNYNNNNYKLPAGGTLTLIYQTNVGTCPYPASYTNSATVDVQNTTVGPATATITIGCPTPTYGTLINGDETICYGGDPSPISFATLPTGAGTFTYQWYYQDGLEPVPVAHQRPIGS